MAKNLKRYAAKLLFQFRVIVSGDSGKRRLCEERIVLMKTVSGKAALSVAKRKGREGQHSYENSDGNLVRFEFIGVIELRCLDACDKDEVWYELVERVLPFERRAKLIKPESALEAIWNRE